MSSKNKALYYTTLSMSITLCVLDELRFNNMFNN